MSIEESFAGMTSALDVDFVHDEVETEKAIQKIEEKKKELTEKVQKLPTVTLEDKDYMQFELKSLISGGLQILDMLSQDIKIGTKPRTHEIYFNGMAKIGDMLRELRELNMTVKKLEIEEVKAGNTTKTDLTVTHKLDGRSLLKMLNKASEENSMNEIEADFKVVDDK